MDVMQLVGVGSRQPVYDPRLVLASSAAQTDQRQQREWAQVQAAVELHRTARAQQCLELQKK